MSSAVWSSPDPLNDSPTFHSPAKTSRSSKVKRSLPLQGSSPTKQTFQLDVGNQLSPQRIRVTVEAGDSDIENAYSHFDDGGVISPSPVRKPVNRRRERTTTTTIPVKGLSDTEGEAHVATPKRGRGRPRKSGTPVPAKQRGRASTPAQKGKGRRKSILEPGDGDNEDDWDFQVGTEVEVGRGKGRSRSRSMKGTSRKSAPSAKQTESLDKPRSSTTGKKGRRRTLTSDVVVLEDETGSNGEEPVSAEVSQSPSTIDGHAERAQSEYSTIRSTTTVEDPEPDVIIARFHPGSETPLKAGWSSPRIIDGSRDLSPTQPVSTRLLPSQSPEMSQRGQDGEDSVAMVPVSPEKYDLSAGIDGRDDEIGPFDGGEGDDDQVGELREFDTILESEGFSMISVDSVPSLRHHLSSPSNQSQERESIDTVRDQDILAVQGVQAGKDDSFSSPSVAILESATPGSKLQDPRLLSMQNARMEDSFSSIPPEILEAATPAGKSKISALLATKRSHIEDSFSSIAPEVLEAATPGRDLSKTTLVSAQPNQGEAYEDSFSAIPSVILDAATPAPLRQTSFKPSSVSRIGSASDRLNVPGSDQRELPADQNGQSSVTTRLPTPEETPSPPGEISSHQIITSNSTGQVATSAGIAGDQLSGDESLIHSQMKSSPPSIAPRRHTQAAHLRQQRELRPGETETPSIIFSSPSLPPPIQFARAKPASNSGPEGQRRALSPTVRAGRVLQDIIVPSSPQGRAQSLGSPFKSPAVERKSSPRVAHDEPPSSQEREEKRLVRLDVAGNPLLEHSQHDKANSSIKHDDPFRNKVPSTEGKQAYSLEVPEQRRFSNPRLSTIRSEGESVLSCDAMSWQAEEEVRLIDAVASLVDDANQPAGVRGSSAGEDPRHPSAFDGTGIWERKWAAERATVVSQIETASTSQVIVINSDDETSTGRVDDDEDFGLLLETLNSSSPAVQPRQENPKYDGVERPRRSKIPSPWRKNSKRLVYSDELSQARVPLAKNIVEDGANDDLEAAELSACLITQESNFKPRVRERGTRDISALLASSPNKAPLPVLTKSSRCDSSLPKESSSGSSSSVHENDERGSSPPQESFTPIPQKSSFKPKVREGKDLESSFASSPVKPPTYGIFGIQSYNVNASNHSTRKPRSSVDSGRRPLETSSPSRTNALPTPTYQAPSAELSPSNCSDESTSSSTSNEQEDQTINSRTTKWMETVHLAPAPMHGFSSPTKSCLRSPLKTPAGGSGYESSASPTKTVAFVSSSPIPSSPAQEPLSSTTWSRDHWVLLDSIVQSWKPANQAGGQERRRRNSTRVISKLLGKTVRSQGESMKLQQWHLEAVDEFRGCVPGWKEDTIAMRVFALLLGEQRRAAGLVGGGQRAI